VKKLLVCLAVFAALAVPGPAYADTITFWAPPTAPNTNNSTDNPGEGDYQGGSRQFDLDHHRAYTWKISSVSSQIPAGHTITGARLTFVSMTNWDTNANRLFVSLLDSARTYSTANGTHSATANGVTWATDATGVPVPASQIVDYFATSNALVADGTARTFIGSFTDTNGVATTNTVVFDFTSAQLQALINYISNGNNFAFGFDPDCHFWNNGIKFEIFTQPQAVPEPATMALLGTGLAGLYCRRRQRRRQ
jgi:hypothetical protein